MFTAMNANKFAHQDIACSVLYGERLKIAMDRRSERTGQKVTRKDVAIAAGCSVQNIGMILTNAKGQDQKLGAQAHTAVATLLKVNPHWLSTGEGQIDPPSSFSAPAELTPAAIEIAALYDMIPAVDKVARAQAFNLATTAIMQVLQSVRATRPTEPQ